VLRFDGGMMDPWFQFGFEEVLVGRVGGICNGR